MTDRLIVMGIQNVKREANQIKTDFFLIKK